MDYKVIEIKKGKTIVLAEWHNVSDDHKESVKSSVVSYAQGYVDAMVKYGKVKMFMPCVQAIDGYHWYNNDTEHFVRCVDENGNIIKFK